MGVRLKLGVFLQGVWIIRSGGDSEEGGRVDEWGVEEWRRSGGVEWRSGVEVWSSAGVVQECRSGAQESRSAGVEELSAGVEDLMV